MALMRPIIAGPVSELSTSLRVRGQFPGATVTIEAHGPAPRVIATGPVTSGDQRLALLDGESLHRTDLLFATQQLGEERSDQPPDNALLTVGPRPGSRRETITAMRPIGISTETKCAAHASTGHYAPCSTSGSEIPARLPSH